MAEACGADGSNSTKVDDRTGGARDTDRAGFSCRVCTIIIAFACASGDTRGANRAGCSCHACATAVPFRLLLMHTTMLFCHLVFMSKQLKVCLLQIRSLL